MNQRSSVPILYLAGGLLAAALGVAVVLNTVAIVVALAAFAAIAVLVTKPSYAIPATVVLAFTAVPETVPRGISYFGASVYFYEVTLGIAVLYAMFKLPPNRYAGKRAFALLAVMLLAVIIGVLGENPMNKTLEDPRGLITLALGICLAARVADTVHVQAVLRASLWSLWASAVLIVCASTFTIPLAGRSEDAGLSFVGQGARAVTGATRYLTSATHFALAAVCIVVALMAVKGVTLRQAWPYLAPAIVVVFFSFSRNSIVAVVVAVLIALLVNNQFRTVVRVIAGTIAAAIGIWLVALFARTSTDLPGMAWLHAQLDAYGSRVFEGLTGQAISTDTSAQYRVRENGYLVEAIKSAPIFGHGMGFAFRPQVGPAGSYTATSGAFYAHNFYYWMWVKSGIVGLGVFAYSAVTPTFSAWTGATKRTAALIGTTVGFLAVSAVAPMPLGEDSGAAVLLGVLIGSLCATVRPDNSPAATDVRRVEHVKVAHV